MEEKITRRIAEIIFILLILGVGMGIGYLVWHNDSNTQIAPSYALEDNKCMFSWGCVRSIDDKPFNDFWQEATKNTQFTQDGKPVEITDIQIFYKTPEGSICVSWGEDKYKTYSPMLMPWATHGNITYYPLGIENSQTYVAPTPGSWQCTSAGCVWFFDITIPMPTPTPCPKCWELENDSMFEGNISIKWMPTPTPCVGIACTPEYKPYGE